MSDSALRCPKLLPCMGQCAFFGYTVIFMSDLMGLHCKLRLNWQSCAHCSYLW